MLSTIFNIIIMFYLLCDILFEGHADKLSYMLYDGMFYNMWTIRHVSASVYLIV